MYIECDFGETWEAPKAPLEEWRMDDEVPLSS